MTRISALTALTSADAGDTLPVLDVSATTTKKITKTAFISDIVDGTLMAASSITPTKLSLNVADSTARLALASPIEGMECYQADVDATYIYDGSAWRRQAQWEELARIAGAGSSTTLTTGTFAARKFLKVLFIGAATACDGTLRFNNDSGSNYAQNYSIDHAANTNTVSQTSMLATQSGSTVPVMGGHLDIVNISALEKTVEGAFYGTATGAANAGHGLELQAKWTNTSAQITRIDWFNTGVTASGNWTSNALIVVLGKD